MADSGSTRQKNGRAKDVRLSACVQVLLRSIPEQGDFIFGRARTGPYSGFSKSKRRLGIWGNKRPFLVGQIAGISQLAAVVALAVLYRPPGDPPRIRPPLLNHKRFIGLNMFPDRHSGTEAGKAPVCA